MKTLIINGSPRKNGDTVSLINLLKSNLDGDITTINTYFDKITPCTDCRYCWLHDSCTINDGITDILCDDYDNIIIASPIYFSQLTGSLLSFASRLQYLWVSKVIRKDTNFQQKQRKGACIFVGGGDGSAEPAINMGQILLKQLNCEIISNVCSLSTNVTPAIEDNNAILEIKQLATLFNKTL